MNQYQKEINKFCEDREWAKFHNPKDILLGIVEEIGELRNIIKWEQDIEVIKDTMTRNKSEVMDAIGDIYWFLTLLANGSDIDIDESIEATIEDNKKRFPVDATKGKHTNVYLGGHDGKYNH